VPGAAREGPALARPRVLPAELIARMQEAVDAAHAAQTTRDETDPEPITEPLPRLQAAVAAQNWPPAPRDTPEAVNSPAGRGDAWSYFDAAATAKPARSRRKGKPDRNSDSSLSVELGQARPADAGQPREVRQRIEPGTDVEADRAVWWDHATRSGHAPRRASGLTQPPEPDQMDVRPPEPRRALEPMRTSKLFRPPGQDSAPDRSPAPEPPTSPLRPIRAELAAPVERAAKPEPADRASRAGRLALPAGQSALAKPTVEKVGSDKDSTDKRGQDRLRTQRPAAPPGSLAIPQASRRAVRRRSGPVTVGVAAAAVVLVAVGIVALSLSFHMRPSSDTPPTKKSLMALEKDRETVADFVIAQVSHDASVACDPVMCRVLIQQGFPSRSVYKVQPNSNYPLSAAVVVETPALRQEFGTSLGTNVAPMVLAEFGRGADRMAVRVVAPHGAHAYEAALRADIKQRKAVGSALATSRQVTANRVVRKALIDGAVDSRLLIAITALASQHPIDILLFGTRYPGASADTPFRMAEFAENGKAAKMSNSDYVNSLIHVLQTQLAAYSPIWTRTTLVGKPVLEVTFRAPSPLGLIGPAGQP
jgi:hypothetical protein